MNVPGRSQLDWTRLFAVAYCTAAYSVAVLLLFAFSVRTPMKAYPGTLFGDDLLELIWPISAALLLVGGVGDGFSSRLRRSIPFRVAAVAMFISLFAVLMTPR